MSTELTNKDYISILKYYNMTIPKSKRLLKKQAESIMAEKLCRCIKKVDKQIKNEAKSIGICSKTLFKKRDYSLKKFTCRKNRTIKFSRSRLNKTKKN
jgi:hypothetical protein